MAALAPKMTVLEYLKLLDDSQALSGDEYSLINQDVKNGFVYFRTTERILLLKQLLIASETKTKPESEVYRKKVSEYNWSEATDGLTVDNILNEVTDIRGPDNDGYYTGRCPVCEENGRDADSDHFRFNPDEEIVVCFAGHSKWDIINAINSIKQV